MKVSRLQDYEVGKNEFVSEYFSSIFDSVNYGVCIINGNGSIEYVNQTYCECFGQVKSLLLKQDINKFRYDEVIYLALSKRKRIESKIIHDKTMYNVEISPILSENNFVGVISFYKKIDKKPIEIRFDNNRESVINPFPNIIGANSRFVRELKICEKVAKTDITILIQGESGTGKELVARSIHKNSHLKEKPWVAINCAAIPENLIESELFGHEAGAFTGANKRKLGKFEIASGGTLFLDEIGDLSPHLQVKLLRVLQEKEFNRVGGNETIKMNARIITATHQNLDEMIEDGTFREDLYYRINPIEVSIIPLRERKDDIPLLVEYFVDKSAKKYNLPNFKIHADTIDALTKYLWKGNIRELKNVIERSVILCDSDELQLQDLPKKISDVYYSYDSSKKPNQSIGQLINFKDDGNLAMIEEYEREIYNFAVEKYSSFNNAGKFLGVTHKTVASKYRKFNFK